MSLQVVIGLCRRKETAALKIKAAVSNGRVDRLLYDGFFSFAVVRQLVPFAFILTSNDTIMYHENDGQHPSLNAFYQMVTMFGISVDEYFYPDMGADEAAKKRINIQLNSLNESELRLVEGIINAIIENRGTEEA